MKSIHERTIQRFERENKEQLETIKKITMALNQPDLFKLLTNNQKDITNSPKAHFYDESANKRIELINEQNKKRILELEAELEQKKIIFKTREKKISDYIEQAKKYEELLEKNEREKQELLDQFQNGSSDFNMSANRSLTLEDLEGKIAAKKQEYQKLKMENSQTKEKCTKLKDQLENSYNYSKALKQKLDEAQNHFTTESPMVKFRNNEDTIESLQKQIERAKKKIKSLTDDNEMLKKLLQSEIEEEEEVDQDTIELSNTNSSKSSI